jgi:hypothetical protein
MSILQVTFLNLMHRFQDAQDEQRSHDEVSPKPKKAYELESDDAPTRAPRDMGRGPGGGDAEAATRGGETSSKGSSEGSSGGASGGSAGAEPGGVSGAAGGAGGGVGGGAAGGKGGAAGGGEAGHSEALKSEHVEGLSERQIERLTKTAEELAARGASPEAVDSEIARLADLFKDQNRMHENIRGGNLADFQARGSFGIDTSPAAQLDRLSKLDGAIPDFARGDFKLDPSLQPGFAAQPADKSSATSAPNLEPFEFSKSSQTASNSEPAQHQPEHSRSTPTAPRAGAREREM